MLREIINFTQSLSPESFKRGLQPAEGLHISCILNNSKQLEIKHFERFKKGQEKTTFLKDCLERQICTSCVSSRKRLDTPIKINQSSSPFCIAYTFEHFREKLLKQDIDEYFDKLLVNAKDFCDSDEQKKFAEEFLGSIDQAFISKIRALPEYENLTKNDYIYIYFEPVSIENFRRAHKNYLSKKAANKEIFNLELDGKTFGVTDYLTSYGDKKLFLQHQTATFNLNLRIESNDLFELFYFAELIRNKQLPNPLPIFIDREELNEKVVKIFHEQENQRIGYADIIRTLYNKHERDLGNYYLLNIQGTKSVSVKDFDFVSAFQYLLEPPIRIENLFIKTKLLSHNISNIFEFENQILSRIFNRGLVYIDNYDRITKKELYYFFEFENSKKQKKTNFIKRVAGQPVFQLVLKYRKAFYDYIYKSKREAVSAGMFHDIMQTSILDDLRQDQFKDGKHTKNFSIKEKLNIWFSLYEFFNRENEKKGGQSMANRIRELQQRMHIISTKKEEHIDSDDEFAFAAGQVIYYLLDQSEAGNKSHALLEPFLQKTDITQFKLAISRVFDRYKHAITFYKGKFEKLMAEVLSYDTESNLKSLMPMTLAGYFSDNVIYQR